MLEILVAMSNTVVLSGDGHKGALSSRHLGNSVRVSQTCGFLLSSRADTFPACVHPGVGGGLGRCCSAPLTSSERKL
jgi:hypothetical protein